MASVCQGASVMTARRAQSLDQWAKKCTRAAGWFDSHEVGQVTVNRVTNKIEDKLDDPFARKDFSVLAVGVGCQLGEGIRDQCKLTQTDSLDCAAHHLSLLPLDFQATEHHTSPNEQLGSESRWWTQVVVLPSLPVSTDNRPHATLNWAELGPTEHARDRA